MSTVVRTLILTGARYGHTVVLAKHQFVKGRLTIVDSPANADSLTKFFGRSYQAYPEGSLELAAALQQGGINGNSEVHPAGQQDQPTAVPSPVQPQQPGPAETPAVDSTAGDGAAPAGTERVPAGDGHGHTGLHRADKLREAVAHLDPLNDEHWTSEGQPMLSVVSTLVGRADLTRAELDEIGVTRPTQEAKQ